MAHPTIFDRDAPSDVVPWLTQLAAISPEAKPEGRTPRPLTPGAGKPSEQE